MPFKKHIQFSKNFVFRLLSDIENVLGKQKTFFKNFIILYYDKAKNFTMLANFLEFCNYFDNFLHLKL